MNGGRRESWELGKGGEERVEKLGEGEERVGSGEGGGSLEGEGRGR